MTARRLLPAALAAVAVLGLSACEAPAPIVTVFSGSTSEWKEADVFCFEDQSLEDDECAERDTDVVEIPVSPGERVGVDVSEELVERGWFVELGPVGSDQAQTSEILDDGHYFAFSAPPVGPQGYSLTIRTLGEDGPRGAHSGEWSFRLVAE
jgi:hypothetical protein